MCFLLISLFHVKWPALEWRLIYGDGGEYWDMFTWDPKVALINRRHPHEPEARPVHGCIILAENAQFTKFKVFHLIKRLPRAPCAKMPSSTEDALTLQSALSL